MQGILFALITFIGWGSGDIFGTITARKIGTYATTIWAYFLGLLIFGLYIPFTWKQLFLFTPGLVLLTLFISVFIILGSLTYNQALSTSNPAVVGVIASSSFGLIALLSVLFFHEQLSMFQTASIVVIFLGVFLCILIPSEIKKGKIMTSGIFFAIITMLCWAIFFTFIKIPVQRVGWFWPNYLSFAMFPLVFIYVSLKKIRLKSPLYKKALIPLLLTVVLLRGADFTYNFAISVGQTSIVAPIAGSFVVLFAILSFLIFKNPIKKQQIVGIVVTIFGIVALSLLSS